MRVSKLSCLNGPEPEPIKLLKTVPAWGAGKAARIFPAAGEIRAIGIRFPANAVRPEPSLRLPVRGSYTWPPPATPDVYVAVVRYSLKSQKPGVALLALVAGLQLVAALLVGIVNVPLTPLVWRVP